MATSSSKPVKLVRGNEDATNALLQKLVDMLGQRANSSPPSQSQMVDPNQYQQLFDMLVDRLSKISGALRYKDAGMTLAINASFNDSGRYSFVLPTDIAFYKQASYEISLQTFAVEQSIPNITSTSNKFYFSKPSYLSGAIQSITLPNGTYDLDTINATIQTGLINIGLYNTDAAASSVNGLTEDAKNYIKIGWVSATSKTVLYIQYGTGITVYFNQPNSIANVLGFLSTDTFTDPNPAQVNTAATAIWFKRFDSTNVLNLTVGIQMIFICCSLAKDSVFVQPNGFTNSSAPILASKPYIDPPGSILSIPASNYPNTPLWLRMNDDTKKLRTIDVFCIDNNSNPVSFSGNVFSMIIGIRQA